MEHYCTSVHFGTVRDDNHNMNIRKAATDASERWWKIRRPDSAPESQEYTSFGMELVRKAQKQENKA